MIDDLTDVLDLDSEDIDGMDDDAGDYQEPVPTGHWKTTSSYDVSMVDTPKDGDDEEATEADSLKKQPKRRRQRRRSKPRHGKNSDKSARRIHIPISPEGSNDHMDPAIEQDDPGHAKPSSEQTPDQNDQEGRAH